MLNIRAPHINLQILSNKWLESNIIHKYYFANDYKLIQFSRVSHMEVFKSTAGICKEYFGLPRGFMNEW